MPNWRRLLSLGSHTAPRIADDIVESKALQKKLAEEAAQEGPEVIGKGTSRAAKEAAGDIPDAQWREITPEPKKITDLDALIKLAKENPKTATALTTVIGGSLSNQMMSEETPEVKFAPQTQLKANEPITPEKLDKQVKKTVKTQPASPEGLDFDALAKKLDEGMASLPKDQSETEKAIDEFEAAKEHANNNALFAMLGKAATQIGGGIASLGAGSQVKIDGSGFDDLLKMSDRPLSQLKEKQAYGKAKAELGDEEAMRDPNSEISKLVSDLAQKTGLIKPGQSVSAMSLKNAGVNLGTLLATIEAGKARKETAAMMAEERKAQKEAALNDKQRKFVQGLRKEATTGVLGKQYATYSTGQRMQSSLEQFAKDPSGYKDYATLMGGLKSLQGDESVVREAEVRLGINATSAINKALNYLQSAINGRQLQPEQRQEMINTIKILTDASKTQYMHSVAPILEQAQMEGIDPELILSGSLAGAKASPAAGAQPAEATTKVFKQPVAPGSTVTTKSGKKYKIGADGVTGTLVQQP